MTKMFDLFNLHDPKYDKSSKGWIRLSGDTLIEEVQKILNEITNTNFSLQKLSEIIAKD